MNWDDQQQAHLKQLERLAGPPVVRFAEWVCTHLWARTRLAAIDMGLSPSEADDIAMAVCGGTMRELRTAVKLVGGLRPGRN